MAPAEIYTREHAASLDREDALRSTRDEFHVPTKAEALSKSLPERGALVVCLPLYPHAPLPSRPLHPSSF